MKPILVVEPQEMVSGNPPELVLIMYHLERELKSQDISLQMKPLVLQVLKMMLLSLKKSIKVFNKIIFLKELKM